MPLRRCQDHQFLTYVQSDERFNSYPIHVDDIPEMPEAKQITEELSLVNMSALEPADAGTVVENDAPTVRNLNNAALAKNFEEFWTTPSADVAWKFLDQYSRKMWLIDDNKLIDDFTWSQRA